MDRASKGKRSSILSKLASYAVQSAEEQRRLGCIDEERRVDIGESEYWLSSDSHLRRKCQNLAYTKDYIAEYHAGTSSAYANLHASPSNQDLSDIASPPTVVENPARTRNQEPEVSMARIPRTDGKARMRRGRMSGNSSSNSTCSDRQSIAEIEQVSTIIPPSVLGGREECASNVAGSEIRRDFFQNYQTNKNLPIYRSRGHVINSINSYSVVIIQGQTGCGKTTQVPIYILEDALLEKRQERAPVIYVTQPRRIAARSIAQHVCDEHNWALGSLVGYQVGLEKKTGPQTILTFCTSGVLLQKLIQEKSLKNYTHIVIDEAHERDADTDLLMMMIRTLMRKEMSFFRLIVMSATIDITKLKEYFTFKMNFGHNAQTTPSICRVETEKPHNEIELIYYDKLASTYQLEVPELNFIYDEPEIHDDSYNAAVRIIVDLIPRLDTYSQQTSTTLVFLPGLAEITKLHKLLLARRTRLDIIPLHSCLSAQDQIRIFLPSPLGYRKVVLATNIAESSITIRDAGFIIDFCLTKTLRKDEVTKFPTLKLGWCSKDRSTQRAGRTGRCCAGKVFRMVPLRFYRGLPEYAEPELLTAPLELSVLRVKNFDMGRIKALLAVVLDPPPLQDIKTAVLELKQIGALSSTYEGELSDVDGDLTELGQVISNLPIDVHLSKLLVVAYFLDVLEDAIIVASCLSTNRTVVKHLYGKLIESYKNKLNWAKGSNSDLFVSLDVYKEYIYYRRELDKDQKFLENYCNGLHLDERKLHDVAALAEEIEMRLRGLNIWLNDQPNRQRNRCEDELMLKIAFCLSFYPNYFLTEELDANEISRELVGFDPSKTVVLHNLPCNQVPLYRTQVVTQLSNSVSGDIEYIADNSRALLVIGDDGEINPADTDAIIQDVVQRSSKVSRSMLLALKHNDCEPLRIREYTDVAAIDRMSYYREWREALRNERILPTMTKVVVGRRANNSAIFDLSQEEYERYFEQNYCIEIDFNEDQDAIDQRKLIELENSEKTVRDYHKSTEEDQLDDVDRIFDGYKTLRGPTSPVQMKFRSVLNKSSGFNVDIDTLSVNSILLDLDYEAPRRQMLVAASVGQTARNNRVMARDTTLMPNVRGLASLMSLLSSQYCRLVYNEPLKCISGAVFGLGWDEEGRPLNKQYEVELGFDVLFNQRDFDLVNAARQTISELIKFIGVENPGSPLVTLQQRLRDIILTLIRERRYHLAPIQQGKLSWTPKKFTPEGSNTSTGSKLKEFLPTLKMERKIVEQDYFKIVRANLNLMDAIDRQSQIIPMEGVQCMLCGSGIGHLFISRKKVTMHLNTDLHLRNLTKFEVGEERARLRAVAAAAAALETGDG